MLTKAAAYVDQGQDYYEERYPQPVLVHLKKQAAAVGLELVPVQTQQTQNSPQLFSYLAYRWFFLLREIALHACDIKLRLLRLQTGHS